MLKEDIIKIPNYLNDINLLKNVSGIYKRKVNENNWCIIERLNGIKLSIISDGKEITSSNNKYFTKIRDKTFIPELFNYLENKYQFKYIQIIGKVIGGIYNHKNIKNNNIKSIFRKPYYCPNISYIIENILLIGEFNYKVLNYLDCIEICCILRLNYNPILKIDTLSNLNKINYIFESKIYKMFNLPKIKNNLSSGLILKPLEFSLIHDNCWTLIEKKSTIPNKINTFILNDCFNLESSKIKLLLLIKIYINNNQLNMNKSQYFNIIKIINFVKKNNNKINYNELIQLIFNIINYLKIKFPY